MKVLHLYIEEVPAETISRARQIMSSLLTAQESIVEEVVYTMTGKERWCIEYDDTEEIRSRMDDYAIVRYWCEKEKRSKIKDRLKKMTKKYFKSLEIQRLIFFFIRKNHTL